MKINELIIFTYEICTIEVMYTKGFTSTQQVFLLCAKMYTCLQVRMRGVLVVCVQISFICLQFVEVCILLTITFVALTHPSNLLYPY